MERKPSSGTLRGRFIEPPAAMQPDIVVAVGATNLGVPGNIVRNGRPGDVIRPDPAGEWYDLPGQEQSWESNGYLHANRNPPSRRPIRNLVVDWLSRPGDLFRKRGADKVRSSLDTADTLLCTWRASQQVALARHAASLRAAGTKAWNVYSIFLTPDQDVSRAREIERIEEDFSLTRKLPGLRSSQRMMLRKRCYRCYPYAPSRCLACLTSGNETAYQAERHSPGGHYLVH